MASHRPTWAALVALLMQVSDLVGRHADAIDGLELNPVWVGVAGQGVQVLDAVLSGRQSGALADWRDLAGRGGAAV